MSNLQAIQAFLAVADHGSVLLASKATGDTASSLSRHVSALEQDWRQKLFERTGRGMVLTDFGQQIYAEAQKFADYSRRFDEMARGAAGLLSGEVKIGLVPSISRLLLVDLVEDLRKIAPSVKVHVVEAFSGSLERKLASGHCDIAVMNRYSDSPRDYEDILGSVDSLLIGSPNGNDRGDHSISLDRALSLPLVVAPMPDGLRTFLNHHAAIRGQKPNILIEVNSLAAMTRLAESGYAYACLPAYAVRDELQSGRLQGLKIIDPHIRRTIAIGYSTHHPMSNSARFAARRIRELVKRFI